jgi:hypothetical protein
LPPRLPPSSAATLPSAFLSFLVHAGVVVGGLMTITSEQPQSSAAQMIIVPIDLVTVADMTDISAVTAQLDEKLREEEAKQQDAVTVAGAPPPDEDTVSFEPPKDKPKEETKKPEVKASPAPPAKSFNSELDDILSSVDKTKPKPQSNSAGVAPASATKEEPRMGAGEKRRMVASIEDIIKSQLITKGCFADHSDMADAKRLRVTLRVWFGRNGKFSQAYQLVSPARDPFNDPPLQAFLAHARRALDKCNNLTWQVPEEYFRLPQPQYIDLTFVPKIGADP